MLAINQFLFIVGSVIQFLAVFTDFKITLPFKSKAYKYDKNSNKYILIKKAKMPKIYGEKGMTLSDKIVKTLDARFLNVILSLVSLIILIYVGYL